MSSNAAPISPARFAAALSALPLSTLHLKAAELRNSISHLVNSNLQLQPPAEDGDGDCKQAIDENTETIMRMEERIALLKAEVEARGFRWAEFNGGQGDEMEDINGSRHDSLSHNGNLRDLDEVQPTAGSLAVNGHRERAEGRRLGDEELARRLRERLEEDTAGNEENGLHL